MKKLFLYIAILFLTTLGVNGQSRRGLYSHSKSDGYSVLIVGGGPAYLFGDVGGAMQSTVFKGSTFNPNSTSGMGSLGFRHIFVNNLSLKANLMYCKLFGSDAETILQYRGYDFSSTTIEASFQAELFLFGGPNSYNNNPHSVFIFAGAGNLTYIPVLTGNSRSQDVIKTGLSNAPILPFGFGYEYYLGEGFSLGSEFGFRYAFSDFLDGLKTPYSQNNDLLLNFNVTVSYNFSVGKFSR